MEINKWLSESGDYTQGLLLYASYKRHNRTALRLLQAKETPKNYKKLKYLLGKIPPTEATSDINFIIESSPDETIHKNSDFNPSEQSTYRPLLLKDLPPELHPLYIKQKADFPTACSLKIKLNALAPNQENEALELSIKIERLFDSIEKSWQIFDHYLEHQVVLKIDAQDFSQKTAVALYKSEKSKRQLISKAKKRIVQLNKKLAMATNKEKKMKISRQIESKNEARIKHELELEKIIELINK